MFTLSDKQRVMNSNSELVIRDAASAVVAAGAVASTDTIKIEGFGSFAVSDIIDIKMNRARAAVAENKDYTTVAPAGLAIGDTVQVKVELLSSRYDSDIQNDYIGGSTPLVFSTAALTAVTPTAIAAAIAAAFTQYKLQFFNAAIPVDITIVGAAAGDITVVANTGYEFVTVNKVTIKRSAQGIANQPEVTLAVFSTTAVGSEGLGLGKYLEESVRMANFENLSPYSIDTAGAGVDIRGEYTEVYFVINKPYEENLSTLAAGNGPLPATAAFTVWMNETTMNGTGLATALMAEVAVLAAAANTNVTVAGASVANMEDATLRATTSTEALIIATGAAVATPALFVA